MKHICIEQPKSYFRVLLISIILIAVLITQAQSIIIFNFYKRASLDTASDIIKNNLKLTNYSIGYIDDTVSSLSMQVFSDVGFIPYFQAENFRDINPLDIKRMANRLVFYKNVFSEVQSIYLYNKNMDYMFCVSNDESLSSKQSEYFKDKEAVNLVKNENFKELSIIPRKLDLGNGREEYIYTIIKTDTVPQREGYDYAVIINIKAKWLTEMLSIMKTESFTRFYLLDSNGLVVGSDDEKALFKHLSDTEMEKEIKAFERVTGHFLYESNEEDYLITQVIPEAFGYRFIALTPYSGLLDDINRLQVILLMIAIAFTLLTVLVSFFTTKRFVKPMTNLYLKTIKLQAYKENSSLYLKQKKLLELIRNPVVKNKMNKTLEELESFELKVDFNLPMRLVTIEINKRDEKEKRKKINSFSEYFKKCFNNDYLYEMMEIQPRFIVLLIQVIDDEQENNQMRELTRISDDMKSEITIAVSRIFMRPEELNIAFEETQNLLRRKFFGLNSNLFFPSEVEINEVDEDIGKNAKEISDSIMQSLVNKDYEKTKRIFKVIKPDLKVFSYEQCMFLFHYIAFIFNDYVDKNKAIFENLTFSFLEFLNEMNIKDNAEEIVEMFINLVEELEETSNISGEDFYRQIALDAKRYLIENYKDVNLSLKLLSSKYHFSTAYFSSIFKKYVGLSVQDYLNEIRIDKAKELLANRKNNTIGDIHLDVGFAAKTHFYAVFRKLVGTSPKKYQQSQSISKDN